MDLSPEQRLKKYEKWHGLTERLLADEVFSKSKTTSPMYEAALQLGLEKLVDYWDSAMFHGHDFVELVPDIDRMIEQLQAFRSRALQLHQVHLAQMSD
jgi:hypothetical protein